MEINKRIIQVMEENDKSPAEFSELLEVPRSSISHIQSGRNRPSLEFLIKLKSVFPDYSWEWLINGLGEKKEMPVREKKNPTLRSIPSLFSEIEDIDVGKNSGKENFEDKKTETPKIDFQKPIKNPISQNIDILASKKNNTRNLVRIVLFYDDQSFESFQP